MKKETYIQLSSDFLEEFEAKIRKDERQRIKKLIIDENDYIGLDYVIKFLSRVMLLNGNGIKKYLFEKNILGMENGKYTPKNKSKYIKDILCIHKSIIKKIININVYVEVSETDKLNSVVEMFEDENTKNTLCMLSYNMHNADEQKNNKKFNRIKTVINKTSNKVVDSND